MTAAIPFLPGRDPASVVAWFDGRAIDARQFVADARALAARLPDRGPVLNGCSDRYRFAIGLAAAMLRERLSVLPHNHMPVTIQMLGEEYPGLTCLADPGMALPGLPGLVPEVLTAVPEDADTGLAFAAGQNCVCLFTSGSTGRPAAYTRTWGVVAAGTQTAIERLALTPEAPMQVVSTVPVQHSYGFESSLMLALMGGGSFVAGRPFYPSDVAQALAGLPRPRMLVTTPVHLRALTGVNMTMPPVDLLLSATAMLDDGVARAAEQQFDARLIEIYGATESGQTATRHTLADKHWQPLRDVTFAVHDGVASVSGGHVGLPVPLSDRLDIRADGRFTLLGRTADIVNVAGKRSSIAHLEQQLLSIPGVTDGAFLVVDPDSDLQRLAAFYVAPDLTRQQVVAGLRARIETVFMPRPLVAVPALPRNATGKAPRQQLLALLGRQLPGDSGSDSSTRPAPHAAHASPGPLPLDARAKPPDDAAHRVLRLSIDPDPPWATGHFPGDPILPGALLLDHIIGALQNAGALAHGPCQVAQARFHAVVRPGSGLQLSWQPGATRIRFECHCGDQVVASGQLVTSSVPGSPAKGV